MRLVFFLLVVACTDRAAIERGQCGNFVLEPGEDCDRPGDGLCTRQCRMMCDVASPSTCEVHDGVAVPTGSCCGDGFVCGAINECRRPSGTFTPAGISFSLINAPFGTFTLADIDDDYIEDAIAVTSGTAIARYGAIEGPLEAAVTRSIPFATGTQALGDYTGDGRPDILIPSKGGIFALETSRGTPEPVLFPDRVDPGIAHVRMAVTVAGAQTFLARLDVDTGGFLTLARDNLTSGQTNVVPAHRPCNIVSDDALPGRSLTTILDGARLVTPLLFPENARTSTPARVCLDIPGASRSFPVADPDDSTRLVEVNPDGEVFFANLAGAATCPDLIVSVSVKISATQLQPALFRYPGNGIPGACDLDTPIALRDGPISVGGAIGRVRLASGKDALIDLTGLIEFGPPRGILPATRDWLQTATGDFNGDGFEDFATIGIGDDIEVFEQRPAGASGIPEWRVTRIPTTGFLVHLDAGDFDGDGAEDIAFASVDAITSRTAQLRVAYRTGSSFAPSVLMASVDGYNNVVAVDLKDPSIADALDHYTDLIVASGGDELSDADPGLMASLFSSADRQMIAPWRVPPYASADSVSIGRYGPSGETAVLVGFADAKLCAGGALTSNNPVLRRAVHTTSTLAVLDPEILTCGARAQAFETSTPVNISDGTRDVVLGLQSDGRSPSFDMNDCAMYYNPVASPAQLSFARCEALLGAENNPANREAVRRVQHVQRISADRILMISERGAGEDGRRIALVWKASVNGGVPRLSDPVDLGKEVETSRPIVCLDATEAELGTRVVNGVVYGEGRELVAACLDEQFLIGAYARFAGDAGAIVEHVGDTAHDFFADLEAGDINGDGLDDLVFAGFLGSSSALLQCDAQKPCATGAQ